MDNVTVTCQDGYVHPTSGEEVFNVTCLDDANWDFEYTACARELQDTYMYVHRMASALSQAKRMIISDFVSL